MAKQFDLRKDLGPVILIGARTASVGIAGVGATGHLGIEISPLQQRSPAALRAFWKAQADRWWPIIKALNIKAE